MQRANRVVISHINCGGQIDEKKGSACRRHGSNSLVICGTAWCWNVLLFSDLAISLNGWSFSTYFITTFQRWRWRSNYSLSQVRPIKVDWKFSDSKSGSDYQTEQLEQIKKIICCSILNCKCLPIRWKCVKI